MGPRASRKECRIRSCKGPAARKYRSSHQDPEGRRHEEGCPVEGRRLAKRYPRNPDPAELISLPGASHGSAQEPVLPAEDRASPTGESSRRSEEPRDG